MTLMKPLGAAAAIGAVLLAALLSPMPFPGRFQLHTQHEAPALKIDTWTGRVWVLNPSAFVESLGEAIESIEIPEKHTDRWIEIKIDDRFKTMSYTEQDSIRTSFIRQWVEPDPWYKALAQEQKDEVLEHFSIKGDVPRAKKKGAPPQVWRELR